MGLVPGSWDGGGDARVPFSGIVAVEMTCGARRPDEVVEFGVCCDLLEERLGFGFFAAGVVGFGEEIFCSSGV